MRKNKLLFSVIFVLLLCALLCITAMATDTESTETTEEATVITGEQTGTYHFTWSLEDGVLTFTPGTEGTQNYVLRADKTHTALKEWKATYASQVIHIVVEEGFKSIETNNGAGPAPLHGFANLQTIKLPSTMVKFNSAYDYKGVFMSNTNLTTIYTGELTEDKIGTADLSGITAMGGTDYGIGYMFSGDKAIEKVILPETNSGNNKYIGAYMFNGCTALKEVNIPLWATEIKKQAFYGCTSLTNIEIPHLLQS